MYKKTIFWLRRVDKQSLWSLRLWVIFRLSNVENLELINKITILHMRTEPSENWVREYNL